MIDRIGAQVGSWRRKLRITQDELGRRCGLSQQHISLLERGRLDPTARTLDKVLKALGLRMEFRQEQRSAIPEHLARLRAFNAWEAAESRTPPAFDEALSGADALLRFRPPAGGCAPEDLEAKARIWTAWRSRLPRC